MSKTQKVLRNVLENISKALNYKNSVIEIMPTNSGGANFTSEIFKARILPEDGEILKLFAKVGFVTGSLRTQLQADRSYSTERFFYTDLASKYEELQKEYKVPDDEKFIIPKFHGLNASYGEETLVLEDLLEAGYQMYDRKKPVDWHYACIAIEELAKLHSLSFAYQNYHRDDYNRNVARLEIILTQSYKELKKSWDKMVEKTLNTVDEEKRAKLKAFLEDFLEEETIMKYYGIGKWGQIVHGDYTPNNLLHKVENGVTTKIVPIDYQTLRLGSPTTDLLYFIYTGTDKEFRTKHLKNLIDHYYESLGKYLKYYGLNPDSIYSRDDFDEDYKEMLPFGLYSTVFVLPIAMVDEKDAPNMRAEGANLTNLSVKTSDEFKVRFNDIVDEFIMDQVI